MPKKLSSLIRDTENILQELRLNPEALTLTLMVYTHDASGTRSVNLRLPAKDVLETFTEVNKKLNKLKKLEQRIETLEKKECKCR